MSGARMVSNSNGALLTSAARSDDPESKAGGSPTSSAGSASASAAALAIDIPPALLLTMFPGPVERMVFSYCAPSDFYRWGNTPLPRHPYTMLHALKGYFNSHYPDALALVKTQMQQMSGLDLKADDGDQKAQAQVLEAAILSSTVKTPAERSRVRDLRFFHSQLAPQESDKVLLACLTNEKTDPDLVGFLAQDAELFSRDFGLDHWYSNDGGQCCPTNWITCFCCFYTNPAGCFNNCGGSRCGPPIDHIQLTPVLAIALTSKRRDVIATVVEQVPYQAKSAMSALDYMMSHTFPEYAGFYSQALKREKAHSFTKQELDAAKQQLEQVSKQVKDRLHATQALPAVKAQMQEMKLVLKEGEEVQSLEAAILSSEVKGQEVGDDTRRLVSLYNQLVPDGSSRLLMAHLADGKADRLASCLTQEIGSFEMEAKLDFNYAKDVNIWHGCARYPTNWITSWVCCFMTNSAGCYCWCNHEPNISRQVPEIPVTPTLAAAFTSQNKDVIAAIIEQVPEQASSAIAAFNNLSKYTDCGVRFHCAALKRNQDKPFTVEEIKAAKTRLETAMLLVRGECSPEHEAMISRSIQQRVAAEKTIAGCLDLYDLLLTDKQLQKLFASQAQGKRSIYKAIRYHKVKIQMITMLQEKVLDMLLRENQEPGAYLELCSTTLERALFAEVHNENGVPKKSRDALVARVAEIRQLMPVANF